MDVVKSATAEGIYLIKVGYIIEGMEETLIEVCVDDNRSKEKDCISAEIYLGDKVIVEITGTKGQDIKSFVENNIRSELAELRYKIRNGIADPVRVHELHPTIYYLDGKREYSI